jgi:hypothetical protein
MPFNPTLGDSRESYDMALALGYDWVERAHSGEDVPLSERVLEREPFTVTNDRRHVIVREVSVRPDGTSRWPGNRERPYRRVRLLPNPLR